MPITQAQIDETDGRISLCGRGEVIVRCGPSTARHWKEETIPLDGRHYKAGGVIVLKNGRELRASLAIQTHCFDYLERDGTFCWLDDAWYGMDEPELLVALGLSAEEVFPFSWLPDRPLADEGPGPYPVRWPGLTEGGD